MTRLHLPSSGPAAWKELLAKPERHWVRGRSAMELALSWEQAVATPRGIPAEVARCLDSSPDVRGASLVLAIPEHKVPLPGGGRPSFDGGSDTESRKDFKAFATMLGAVGPHGTLTRATPATAVPLLVGWVDSETAPDSLAVLAS